MKVLSASLWIKILGALLLVVTAFLLIFGLTSDDAVSRAVVGMTMGLLILWVGIGGTLMFFQRDRIRERVLRISLGWRAKFLLSAILLALIEEAITTLMTNLAPLFGVQVGQAYITASANYLDVILFHSVIVLIPMFLGWMVLLGYWDFSPGAVFLLFGLTGTLAESLSFGTQNLALLPMWIFVYGLMIYLPVYCLPPERGTLKPRFFHYGVAIIFPILFAIPVAIIVGIIHPYVFHFPPLPAA